MQRLRKRIITVAIAVIGVSLIVYSFIPAPVPVDITETTRGPLRVTVNEDGMVRVKERYVVSAPVPGRLRRITLDPGDRVDKNETKIAVIDPPPAGLLDERTLSRLTARLEAARLAHQNSLCAVDCAQSNYLFAVKRLERAESLFEKGGISPEQMDAAEQNAINTKQKLTSAEFNAQISEFETKAAESALIQTTNVLDEHETAGAFTVYSPIDGQVLRLYAESAATVSPGTPLVEIGNTQMLEATIDVLSQDATRIQSGDKVLLENWGGDNVVTGRVTTVEPHAFTKVSALGVEEQRVWIKAGLISPPELYAPLGDGYRVEARIVTWESDGILQVPVGALFRSNEEWSVFIMQDGRAHLRNVVVGHRNDRMAEVIDGLEEHDRVVLYPQDAVADGVRVELRN